MNFLRARPMKTVSVDEQIMPREGNIHGHKGYCVDYSPNIFAESRTHVKNNRSVGHCFINKHVDVLICYNNKTLFHLEVEVFITCV